MSAIIALFILAIIGVTAAVFGLTVAIVYNLVLGVVVGALARLALPGEENMTPLSTMLMGMLGGAGGHLIGRAFHLGPALQLIASVAVAAGLISALGMRKR